jgi:GNAT superfamily N-acetyltransferase
MNLIVRQATPEDAEAASVALRRSITECCQEDHKGDVAILDAWLANKTAENVRRWFQSPGFAVVAERDGVIVGTAMLTERGVLALCYLVPEARFCGAGKAMLRVVEEEARSRKIGVIELGSTRTAHQFYRRNGYSDTGADESAFGLTAIGMRKTIKA